MIATELQPLETLADLMERLGDVPLHRIRLHPFPGTATVADVLRLCDGEPKCLCELVDGVLVEKVFVMKFTTIQSFRRNVSRQKS